MTRKDFALIAEAIKRVHDVDYPDMDKLQRGAVLDVAQAISYSLRRTNPRFDKARFMSACGFPANW